MKQYDLAVAQFIGYIHGSREPGLRGLVVAMNLTKAEWEKIKKEGLPFKPSEIKEVDKYFEQPED